MALASYLPNLLLCALFLLTGVTNATLTQIILYTAKIDSRSFLLVFCSYLGYSLRYFLPESGQKKGDPKDEEKGFQKGKNKPRDRTKAKRTKGPAESKTVYLFILLVTLAEIAASQLATIGFGYVGSGLYQVLYSSIILFTALVAFFVLRRSISIMQWLALACITLGLILSAGKIDTTQVPIRGVISLFTATLIFAFTSTASETIMQKYKIPSSKYSMIYGIYGAIVIAVYIVLVSSTHWDEWVLDPIKEANANIVFVFTLLTVLVLGQLARGIVYYSCLENLGSVSTGVLYALQAVCMFGLSAVFFCDPVTRVNQCYTPSKAVGTAVVSGGVALYSLGKRKEKDKDKD